MAHPICGYLQEKIKAFLASKNQSLRWLSKQTDVDYSTIYRLQSGEQKSLDFFPAYQLLKLIEPKGFQTVLGEYFPDETREFLVSNQNRIEDQSTLVELVVSSAMNHAVFQYLTNTAGSSRSTISKEFGQFGLAAVDELVKGGVLTENGEGSYVNNLEGSVLISGEASKSLAAMNLSLLNLVNPGTHIYGHSAGLNFEGLKKCHEAVAQCVRTLRETARDDKFKGSLVYLAAIASGPMVMKKGAQ